jgi:hypothetical protein
MWNAETLLEQIVYKAASLLQNPDFVEVEFEQTPLKQQLLTILNMSLVNSENKLYQNRRLLMLLRRMFPPGSNITYTVHTISVQYVMNLFMTFGYNFPDNGEDVSMRSCCVLGDRVICAIEDDDYAIMVYDWKENWLQTFSSEHMTHIPEEMIVLNDQFIAIVFLGNMVKIWNYRDMNQSQTLHFDISANIGGNLVRKINNTQFLACVRNYAYNAKGNFHFEVWNLNNENTWVRTKNNEIIVPSTAVHVQDMVIVNGNMTLIATEEKLQLYDEEQNLYGEALDDFLMNYNRPDLFLCLLDNDHVICCTTYKSDQNEWLYCVFDLKMHSSPERTPTQFLENRSFTFADGCVRFVTKINATKFAVLKDDFIIVYQSINFNVKEIRKVGNMMLFQKIYAVSENHVFAIRMQDLKPYRIYIGS